VDGGTTSGGGTVNSGDSVTITATPNAGYTFTNWTEAGAVVSTSSSYTFTADADHSFVANFDLPVTISTSGTPLVGGSTSGGGAWHWLLCGCSSRLVLGATAFQKKRGTGYYNNFMLLLNRFELGLTDYLSINVGLFVLPPAMPYYANIKSTFEVLPLLRVGANITYYGTITSQSYFTESDLMINTWAPSIIGGYGTKEHNINVSLGWTAGNASFATYKKWLDFAAVNRNAEESIASNGTFLLNVGGQTRFNDKISLVGELVYANSSAVGMAGLRVSGQKVAWDFGITSLNRFVAYPLPYLAYTYNF
jgi:hypothetical protein